MLEGKAHDRLRKAFYRAGRGGQSRPFDDRDSGPDLGRIAIRQMMAVPDRQVSESALCLTGLTYVDQPPFQPDTVQHGPTDQRARSPAGHERNPETVGE